MFIIEMASSQLKIVTATPSSRSRLVSKLYGDEVLCALRSLQQNDMLCDFTVTADGKSLRVCSAAKTAETRYLCVKSAITDKEEAIFISFVFLFLVFCYLPTVRPSFRYLALYFIILGFLSKKKFNFLFVT